MTNNADTGSKKNLVSIIIPLYNGEDQIIRCLESIVNQTYKNIELIVVDDGSTDQSFERCNSYLKDIPNSIVLRQENSGPSLSRKHGFDSSHGEYIMFLDSDDYLDKNCVECSLKNIIMLDCDILQYRISTYNKYHYKAAPQDKVYDGVDYYIRYRKHGDFLWDKIYKRSIIAAIEFPSIYHSEDAYMIMQFMYHAKKVCRINDVLYYHMVNNEGLSLSSKYVVRKVDQAKAGLLMIAFSKGKNKLLYSYSKVYTCVYAANNYLNIKRTGQYKKEMDFLRSVFVEHFSFSNTVYFFFHNTISFNRFVLLLLFRIYSIFFRKKETSC